LFFFVESGFQKKKNRILPSTIDQKPKKSNLDLLAIESYHVTARQQAKTLHHHILSLYLSPKPLPLPPHGQPNQQRLPYPLPRPPLKNRFFPFEKISLHQLKTKIWTVY
jgi:hypothetical protein